VEVTGLDAHEPDNRDRLRSQLAADLRVSPTHGYAGGPFLSVGGVSFVSMAEPEQIMARIGKGIELRTMGERAAARRLFSDVWAEIGPEGDALHRCALAHSMADAQDDPLEELRWDLVALEAADSVTDDHVREAGIPATIRAFYPSLHLNLGDVYRRLGDVERAADHLTLGRAAVEALPDDGYGRMITGGLDRLAERLSAAR
jgi:hypothetical protein